MYSDIPVFDPVVSNTITSMSMIDFFGSCFLLLKNRKKKPPIKAYLFSLIECVDGIEDSLDFVQLCRCFMIPRLTEVQWE